MELLSDNQLDENKVRSRTSSDSSYNRRRDSGVMSKTNSKDSIKLNNEINLPTAVGNGEDHHLRNSSMDKSVNKESNKTQIWTLSNGKIPSTGEPADGSDSCFGSQILDSSVDTLTSNPLKTDPLFDKKAFTEVTNLKPDGGKEMLKLNISGTEFQASVNTLLSIPDTRLSELAILRHDDESYDPLTDMYVFEKNPVVFSDILDYFRSGELHLDQTGCGIVMERELEFWRITPTDISVCCWHKYDASRSTNKMYEELDKLFDEDVMKMKSPDMKSCWDRFRFYVFQTLENPSFSVGARMFSILSMIITLASIFTFVSETHYLFKQVKLANGTLVPAPEPEVVTKSCCCVPEAPHITNHTGDEYSNETHNETDLEHSIHDEAHVDAHLAFHYIDFFTFGYFSLEIIVRFAFAYSKLKFFKSALNIVEVICIGAHFISLIEHSVSVDSEREHQVEQDLYLIFILRSLRIMRVARIFKLFRHMTGFKVLIYTIVVSISELLLIVSFLFAGVLIFASIIHYAEEETFPNIPYAIWWALVTMTTVGYGDVVPKSPMGYFIGALCVVTGILVIAFTVPVVVNNFTIYYSLCKSRQSRLKIVKILENKNKNNGLAGKSGSRGSGSFRSNAVDVQALT